MDFLFVLVIVAIVIIVAYVNKTKKSKTETDINERLPAMVQNVMRKHWDVLFPKFERHLYADEYGKLQFDNEWMPECIYFCINVLKTDPEMVQFIRTLDPDMQTRLQDQKAIGVFGGLVTHELLKAAQERSTVAKAGV